MVMQILKSKIPLERSEVIRRMHERGELFAAVPGLYQKYYGLNDDGWSASVYFFASHAALDAYLETDLSKSIETAYAMSEPVVRERYEFVKALHPDLAIHPEMVNTITR
jgi:hypothetical protein